MSTYIRGSSTNYANGEVSDLTTPSIAVDSVGQTLFVAYFYRNNPSEALVATPTWNGESFEEVVNRGNLPGDDQQVLQLFRLTTASTGSFPIIASNAVAVTHAAAWALYSDVTSVTPIELEEQWSTSGYTNPELAIAGDGTVLNILGASNWDSGFADLSATTWAAANGQTIRQSAQNTVITCGRVILADVESASSATVGFTPSAGQPAYVHAAILIGGAPALPSIRKSGTATFDKPAGIGTITGVTLNGAAITLDSQDATTFTVTDSDASITTSGAYNLVATGDTVETISVQVSVYGVAPANNPWQRDGAAKASLTGVQYRLSAGTTLAGSQLYYTATGTTDASGNIPTIDVSDTAANDGDSVLLEGLDSTGDSIVAVETVGLI